MDRNLFTVRGQEPFFTVCRQQPFNSVWIGTFLQCADRNSFTVCGQELFYSVWTGNLLQCADSNSFTVCGQELFYSVRTGNLLQCADRNSKGGLNSSLYGVDTQVGAVVYFNELWWSRPPVPGSNLGLGPLHLHARCSLKDGRSRSVNTVHVYTVYNKEKR